MSAEDWARPYIMIDPLDGKSLLVVNPGLDFNSLPLVNVHDATKCWGTACVVHNPSEHRLRRWPLYWRNDRGIFERLCVHGIGHPDPDDVAYTGDGVHGCDGCCWDPVNSFPPVDNSGAG